MRIRALFRISWIKSQNSRASVCVNLPGWELMMEIKVEVRSLQNLFRSSRCLCISGIVRTILEFKLTMYNKTKQEISCHCKYNIGKNKNNRQSIAYSSLHNNNQMFKLINRFVKAPLTYIADLRAISFKEYLLISTNFSPSYPIMIFTSLGFTLMYCAILIYFVFTSKFSENCYKNVHGAAYLITILYPIQTILCFICLTGSIALSKSNCWRVIIILLFGPIVCGFGYGQVGIIQICLLSGVSDVFTVPSIMKQPEFIDAMVYLYIGFLALYFILVPSIGYLYNRQNADQQKQQPKQTKQSEKQEQKEQPPKQSSCCDKLICVLYYICNTLFLGAILFIFFIKLVGPVIYTFVWIKIGMNLKYFTQPMEKFMFAGLLLAYFAPLGMMLITLSIQRLVKLGRGKKDSKSKESTQKSQRDTWQPNDPSIEIDRSSRMSASLRKTTSERAPPIHLNEHGDIILQQKGKNKEGLL